MINRKITRHIVFLLLVVLAGCNQPTIEVYVTPTPEDEVVGVISTAFVVPNVLDTEVVVPTSTRARPSNTPSAPSVTPGPTVTFMGPIVGEGYNPPATEPPPPTEAPPATNTQEAVSQQQPTQVPTNTEPPAPTAAPTTAGTPLPAFNMSDVGIQVFDRVEREEWYVIMNQVENDLSMGWIKVQIAWDFYQQNGPGEVSQELDRLEIYLEQIHEIRDVRVLISIAKAPDWARTDSVQDGPPDDPQELANFITLVLQEFGSHVDAVEVWNEPNLIREWHGKPMNGATYMQYFDAGYNAVRAFNPEIVVISAGLAPTADSDGTRNDRTFLREMYNAGLANYSNVGIGIHPYGWANPPDARCCGGPEEPGWDEFPQFYFLDTIEDYREIQTAYGDTDAQLWVTEFGWASWEGLPGQPPDVWMGYNSKWDQANYTLRAIQIMQSLDYVGPMFLWNLNFALPPLIDQQDERVAYSIVLPEGAPRERPLYWMLFDAVRPDEELTRYD